MKDYHVTGYLPHDAEERWAPSGKIVLEFHVRVDRDFDEPEDADQVLERFRIDDPRLIERFRKDLLSGRAVTVHARRCLIEIVTRGVKSSIPSWRVVELRVPNRSAPPKTTIHPALQDAANESPAAA